ncbi:Ger(x)C family spore germination protein [Paenibacillus alba]|uniref:Ger(x)C family spore germination protein n=1 Tax=Paenibacillus alba TaxID=1197127 RepID=UPI0015673871|nr:Ger(x)C family spore germination protein [Paenibacillus alba]NQX64646.1 Ger(x)C family spore germination protein [Paenibacillus alba]
MISRCIKIILSVILTIPLAGCWDRKELNELGIAVAIGVDFAPKNQLKVTAQVVLPSEIAPSQSNMKGGTSVTVYEVIAPTLLEAIQKMTEISPRKVYMGHIKMFIFGESYARKGVSEVVETMVREPTVRSDYYIAVAKGRTASEVLQVTTPLEPIPANKMFASLDASSETWAPTTKVTMDELMDNLLNCGCPILTGIQIVGDLHNGTGNSEKNKEKIHPDAQLQFTGLGVFKKDRLIGWLDEDESKAYNYIKDQVKQTIGHIDMPGGERIGVHLLRSKTVLQASVVQGSPEIRVMVTNEGILTEVHGTTQEISTPEDLRLIEQTGSEKIIELMKQSVDSVRRKFKFDIFGFGQLIHESDPKAWKKLEENWDQTYMDLPIHYTVKTKIGKLGTLLDTFQKKMKE